MKQIEQGTKVRIFPTDYVETLKRRKTVTDKSHPHYKKTGVVISDTDRLGNVYVALDDFPECNHREKFNRFLYSIKELEAIQT